MDYKKLLALSQDIQNDKLIDCVNIAIISNISFDPYFTPLITKRFFDINNLRSKVFPIPYEEYDSIEHKESFKCADLIVVWLNYELLFCSAENTTQQIIGNATELSKRLFDNISTYSNGKIVWILFENYFENITAVVGHNYAQSSLVDRINLILIDTMSNDISFIDLKCLIAEVGINSAYDSKGKYRWNAPYSKTLIEIAVKEIHKQYLIEKGITKKCLVLDCDNVLWGGILSEDGVENIKLGRSGLGRPYQDFQRFILSLYYRGVILAVCSKNDLPDVLAMFREHSEMILKEEHIACFQVNWGDKPDNIKKIPETLNIGLDSIVFVDDSPIEIGAMKSMLSEVTPILYDRDTVYEQLSCFNLNNKISIADIEKRNETYRTNKSREHLKSQYDNYSDYINVLDIKIDIHRANLVEVNRISELTQRTTKCTNGKRYTVTEIKEFIASENFKLYSISVSDIFSDLGIVGAIGIEGDFLKLFCLSCRALGRELEKKMLTFIIDNYKINKYEFYNTGKNDNLQSMLETTFVNAKTN